VATLPDESRPAPPPPTLPEAVHAVARLFGAIVTVDASSGQGFVAADLNGDGSEELAVVVRPVPDHLAEINDDLANWMVQDPKASAAALVVAAPRPVPARVRVEAGDSLLAVVPGYGPAGWRDEASRHGFLLRNAVGAKMESRPLDELVAAGGGGKFARDAITEVIGGRPGFIYWTGAKYLWRDLGESGAPAIAGSSAGSPHPRVAREP